MTLGVFFKQPSMKIASIIAATVAAAASFSAPAQAGLFDHFDEPWAKPAAMEKFQACYERVVSSQQLAAGAHTDVGRHDQYMHNHDIRQAAIRTCKFHLKGRWVVPSHFH